MPKPASKRTNHPVSVKLKYVDTILDPSENALIVVANQAGRSSGRGNAGSIILEEFPSMGTSFRKCAVKVGRQWGKAEKEVYKPDNVKLDSVLLPCSTTYKDEKGELQVYTDYKELCQKLNMFIQDTSAQSEDKEKAERDRNAAWREKLSAFVKLASRLTSTETNNWILQVEEATMEMARNVAMAPSVDLSSAVKEIWLKAGETLKMDEADRECSYANFQKKLSSMGKRYTDEQVAAYHLINKDTPMNVITTIVSTFFSPDHLKDAKGDQKSDKSLRSDACDAIGKVQETLQKSFENPFEEGKEFINNAPVEEHRRLMASLCKYPANQLELVLDEAATNVRKNLIKSFIDYIDINSLIEDLSVEMKNEIRKDPEFAPHLKLTIPFISLGHGTAFTVNKKKGQDGKNVNIDQTDAQKKTMYDALGAFPWVDYIGPKGTKKVAKHYIKEDGTKKNLADKLQPASDGLFYFPNPRLVYPSLESDEVDGKTTWERADLDVDFNAGSIYSATVKYSTFVASGKIYIKLDPISIHCTVPEFSDSYGDHQHDSNEEDQSEAMIANSLRKKARQEKNQPPSTDQDNQNNNEGSTGDKPPQQEQSVISDEKNENGKRPQQ